MLNFHLHGKNTFLTKLRAMSYKLYQSFARQHFIDQKHIFFLTFTLNKVYFGDTVVSWLTICY